MIAEIPDIKLFGRTLYIESKEDYEGEAKDYASMAGEAINKAIKAQFDMKPDWYYKAKARHTLGLD